MFATAINFDRIHTIVVMVVVVVVVAVAVVVVIMGKKTPSITAEL